MTPKYTITESRYLRHINALMNSTIGLKDE